MIDPNAPGVQVGGGHYGGRKFQHWDLIEDYGIGYLEGYATKYIARCRAKNGVEDLKKARHCVVKLGSLYPRRGPRGAAPAKALRQFAEDSQLTVTEEHCVNILCSIWDVGQLSSVVDMIDGMIADAQEVHGR